jgi:hypothetical protein
LLRELLSKMVSRDDPDLAEGEAVELRGPGGLSLAGVNLSPGMLVLTNRRLWFKPERSFLWGRQRVVIELPLDSIESLTAIGGRSLGDPLPGVQHIALLTTSGERYVLQTLRWEAWGKRISELKLPRASSSEMPH